MGDVVHRVALVLPASTYRAPDFLAAARAVGAEVVIATESRQALAEQMGDRLVEIDLARPEWSAEQISKRAPLHAVLAVDDAGVVIAARAAASLGLPHNHPDAAAATRDKLAMRRRLQRAGVPQPAFAPLAADEEPGEVVARLGLPAVLKPTGLAAGQGVLRVDDAAAADAAGRRIRRIVAAAGGAAEHPLLAERFVPGPEVAVEGVLTAGTLRVLAMFDKPGQSDGPAFPETMLVTPSRLPAAASGAIASVVQSAVAAIGLEQGPIHAELRIGDDGPVLLEVAARPIGGLCGRALHFGLLGASLETVLLRAALGLPQGGWEAAAPAAGALMLYPPRAGRVRAIRGIEEARTVAGVTGVEITVALGKRIAPPPEGSRYLGFVFAAGLTPQEVESALARAGSLIAVEMEPA